MGNFPKARSLRDLDNIQRERYDALRSQGDHHPVLAERLEQIRDFGKGNSSGEMQFALEELRQDAFVRWVLANEDPTSVEWLAITDMVEQPAPLTPEEELANQKWNEEFFAKVAASHERLAALPKPSPLERICDWWHRWTYY